MRKSKKRGGWFTWNAILLATTALGGMTQAHAQEEESGGVGEIIVTATKRAENLQDVPVSVQALDAQRLQDLNITDFADYAQHLPTLSYSPSYGPGYNRPFMRGVASGENGNPDQDKSDKAAPPVSTASVLGMTVGELNDQTRQKFGIAADVSGVVVTDVAKDSAAAERGIQPGEVITGIAQESVGTPKDVMDRIGALKEQGRKNALLMLASKTGELRFVTIRMD